jgi:hypothetical protein
VKDRIGRSIGGLVFVAFGCIALFSIWSEWLQAPQRAFHPKAGKVLSHDVVLDVALWQKADPAPLRLDSTVLLGEREIRVNDYFESSDDAWSAALARPPATAHTFFASPDERVFVWRRLPAFNLGVSAAAVVCVLVGVVACFPARDRSLPIIVSVTLLVGGGVFAFHGSKLTVRSFMASDWPAVRYEEIGNQRLKSGRRGANATAFRYTYAGRTYESVVRTKPPSDGVCRINPDKPWIAALNTNYLVNAVATLFAVPFLAGGVFFLVAIYRNRR